MHWHFHCFLHNLLQALEFFGLFGSVVATGVGLILLVIFSIEDTKHKHACRRALYSLLSLIALVFCWFAGVICS